MGLARTLARSGEWVLVVGGFTCEERPEYPTVAAALANGSPVAACVRGHEERIDILPLGQPRPDSLSADTWWDTVRGRYDFVVCALG